MTMSKLTPHTERKTIVMKLGGSMLSELQQPFFNTLRNMQREANIIITHGGGPNISRALQRANIASETVNGLRVTPKDAAMIVRDVLLGEVNAPLVKRMTNANIRAIGLSGYDDELFTCTYLDRATYGEVGEVQRVNTELLRQLFALDLIPVVSCVGCNEEGEPLNINGDDAATAIAVHLHADEMVFVTDVEGLLVDGEVVPWTTEQHIQEWMQDGTIYGGMIPKVKGAVSTLREGVRSVRITNETLTGTVIGNEGELNK